MASSKMPNTGCPAPATLARNESVLQAIHLTYIEGVRYLSQLQGQTFEEYCSQENVPRYILNVFLPKEIETLDSGRPVEQLNIQLLYKLLRYVSGLARRENPVWEKNSDTLEYLIYFTHCEIEALKEASGITDYNLNQRLNKLVECLIGILIKVEKKKNVDLTSVKKKVLGSLASQSMLSDVDCCFKIATQQLIHKVFRLAYNQLNVLDGRRVDYYLKEKSKFLRPMRSFSITERCLLQHESTGPECMPIGLLYKLLQRVCDLKDHTEWAIEADILEHSLYTLKQEFDTIVLMDSKSITDRSRRIHKHLEIVIGKISEKTGKHYSDVIAEMPKETQYLDDSFQKLPQETPSHHCPSAPESPQPGGGTVTSDQHDTIYIRPGLSSISAICSRDLNEENPLTPEEFNMAVLFKALRPGGTAAKVLYRAYTELSGNTSLVDSEYLRNFTVAERQIVTGDNIKESDITLLSKLLRVTCNLASSGNAVWTTEGDTLEYYITCVKKERNEFAHELTSLTNEELKTKLQNLESYLENILLKTSERKSVDLQGQIDDMKKELKALSNAFDPVNYCKSVKEMKNILSDKMVTEAKVELKQAYQRASVKTSSPVTWIHERPYESITIEKVYVHLDVVDASDEGTTRKYSLEDLINPNARVIVVQGESGVGKTTLCKYIVHLWSKDEPPSSLKDVDLLLYIQCRYITSSSSLSSYLMANLPRTFSSVNESDVIPMLQDPRLLLVVDGYDEAQENAKKLLDDILHSLPESRIIITSKPQWVPKLKSRVHQVTSSYTILSVAWCNKAMRYQYIQNYFFAILEEDPQKVDKCEAFLSFLSDQEDKLQALTQKPLTLALLACLWISDSAKAKETRTVAQLYKTLTDFIVQRFEDKENVTDYDLFREWLGEIAWNSLQKNQHHLSEMDIKKLKRKGRDHNIDSTKALPYFLHCRTQASLTECTVWTFTHNCHQEFLAAEYISHHTVESKEPLENILGLTGSKDVEKKLQRLIPVIEFISDLLYHSGEMDENRLKEIAEITLKVQAPWSFASARRMFQNLLTDVPEKGDVFKEMLKGQVLSEFLEGYDPESIHWILQKTSLSVPRYVHLQNSVTSVLIMIPLLDLLNSMFCKPEVTLVIDSFANFTKIADIVEEIKSRTARVAIMTWNPYSLAALVKNWPWSSHLCLYFPMEVFPLLWWELVVNLVIAKVPGVKVLHGLADTKLMKSGVNCLGAEVVYSSNHSPSHLLICAKSDTVK